MTDLTDEQAAAHFAEIGLERLSPDRARQMFDELGAIPTRDATGHDADECDISDALAWITAGQRSDWLSQSRIKKAMGYPGKYRCGLAAGWYGWDAPANGHWRGAYRSNTLWWQQMRAQYRAGVADGRAAWEALNPAH
jgi:hypothetical protein